MPLKRRLPPPPPELSLEVPSSCNPCRRPPVRKGVDGGTEGSAETELARELAEPVALGAHLTAEIPRLRGFLARLAIRTSCDVDDLVQESLARALRYQSSFEGDRTIWPWLKRVAFRVFLDHRGRRQFGPKLHEVEEPGVEDKHPLDQRDEVLHLLAQLPKIERELLLRFHQRGESVAHIAMKLRMPAGTVKSHLHRARRRLAEQGRNSEEQA